MDHKKWVFIVQSWSPSSGIKLFVNGCIVLTSTKQRNRSHAVLGSAHFVIGKSSNNMEIDNFLAWDGELPESEAWGLYVQAVQV